MFNLINLSDKNIVITGGTSGIGKETAILLSKLGARLVIIGRNEEKFKELHHILEGKSEHYFMKFDLTKYQDYEEIFKNMNQRCGKIDGLVHSAGYSKYLPLRNITINHINDIMNINFYSFIFLSKYVTKKKYFSESGGSIVALSSIASNISKKGLSIYSASKSSINISIKSLSQEYAPRKIRFNAVAPGFIKTDLTDKTTQQYTNDVKLKMIDNYPLGEGNTRDIANTIAFLLSDSSRWITGTVITVDGGYTTS